MAYKLSDSGFEKALYDYLAKFSEGQEPAGVPLMTVDGTLGGIPDRVKTLEAPCFMNMGDELTRELLEEEK